jgi:putative heme transporter
MTNASSTRSGPRPVAILLRRFWPAIRVLVAVAILGATLWALSSHTDELSGIPGAIERLNWWWVWPAVAAEMASFLCFAGLQRAVLTSGGLKSPEWTLVKMTFASQAIANSLPGGNAVSAVYGFRWFRRFGADDTLAAWAMVGSLIASLLSLSLIATAGLAIATSAGASLDLIPVLIGVLVTTLVVGALFLYERPLLFVLPHALRLSHAVLHRPRTDVDAEVDRISGWISSLHLSWRQVVAVVLWGAANWLFDCACFAMMFPAIHSTIPWDGLLLAYGAGQLAAALPITPGGLGVVEGSITIALVAFGGAQVATVDAVLLYRLISFWLILAIGWALCGELALEVRRGRWARRALASPVEAGPGPVDPSAPVPGVGIEQMMESGS